MDADNILIVGRIAERLLIIACSVYVINIGVKLLINGTGGKASIDIKTLAGKFKLTNAASGLVVILLGIIGFYISIESKLEIELSGKTTTTQTTGSDSTTNKTYTSKTAAAKLDTHHSGVQTAKTVTQTETKQKISYSDAETAGYIGPRIALNDLRGLYNITYAMYKDDKADPALKKKLLDIYTNLYTLNALSPDDEKKLTSLQVRDNLSAEEDKMKTRLQNKLTNEYDYHRITQ